MVLLLSGPKFRISEADISSANFELSKALCAVLLSETWSTNDVKTSASIDWGKNHPEGDEKNLSPKVVPFVFNF